MVQLTDLLPRLPRLRELRLSFLHIYSLAFLAQPPLTSQLADLRLWSCEGLPPAELRHIHALLGLEKLELCLISFTVPLGMRDCALLTELRAARSCLPADRQREQSAPLSRIHR